MTQPLRLATTPAEVTAVCCRASLDENHRCNQVIRAETSLKTSRAYRRHLAESHPGLIGRREAKYHAETLIETISGRISLRYALTDVITRLTGTAPTSRTAKDVMNSLGRRHDTYVMKYGPSENPSRDVEAARDIIAAHVPGFAAVDVEVLASALVDARFGIWNTQDRLAEMRRPFFVFDLGDAPAPSEMPGQPTS